MNAIVGFTRFTRRQVFMLLAVVALFVMAFPAFAQLPTAEPMDEITVANGVGAGLSILQTLGLAGLLTIAAVLFVAAQLMRKGKSAAR